MFHKCYRSTHPRDRFRAFFFPKKNVFHIKMNCLETFFWVGFFFGEGGGGGGGGGGGEGGSVYISS